MTRLLMKVPPAPSRRHTMRVPVQTTLYIEKLDRRSRRYTEAAAIYSNPLILDVLCYPPHRGFRRKDIAGAIDGNPLAHGSIGRISFVRRHEDCHLAVLQAPNANALEPAWMPLWIRFRVCRINCVVPVYR